MGSVENNKWGTPEGPTLELASSPIQVWIWSRSSVMRAESGREIHYLVFQVSLEQYVV